MSLCPHNCNLLLCLFYQEETATSGHYISAIAANMQHVYVYFFINWKKYLKNIKYCENLSKLFPRALSPYRISKDYSQSLNNELFDKGVSNSIDISSVHGPILVSHIPLPCISFTLFENKINCLKLGVGSPYHRAVWSNDAAVSNLVPVQPLTISTPNSTGKATFFRIYPYIISHKWYTLFYCSSARTTSPLCFLKNISLFRKYGT